MSADATKQTYKAPPPIKITPPVPPSIAEGVRENDEPLTIRKVRALVTETVVYGKNRFNLKKGTTFEGPAEVVRWLIKTHRVV